MCAKITPKNYIFVIQIKFIVLSKKNHRMIKEAIFVLILICTTSFDICSEIEFSDYSFDLSSISNQTIELSGLSGLIKFYNCYPDTCQNSNYPSETTAMNQQKAFLLQVVSGMCIPMSISATTFSNYNYIDSENLEKGLKIDFYPYITTQEITDNITTYINQTVYDSQFLVYCNSETQNPSICQESQSSGVNSTRNGKLYSTKTISLTCSIYNSAGCPSLTLNNFWKFLFDNKIWFAIVLWIISVFEFFLGYFVIRLTILIYGIMTGAFLGVIFSAQNYENFFDKSDSNGIIIFIIVLSFLMGATFGLALLTFPKLGYVNIGFWVAAIFSLLLQNSVLYKTGSMVAFYITLGVSAFVMAGISLLGFRKFIIVSTAFVSSFWIIRSLGFILPYYPNELSTSKLFTINQSTPWQFYLYLVSIIILTVLGCVFQFCWYKKKGKDQGNHGYYLQDDDTLQNKFKKLLQFQDIRKMISAGKQEVMFLKNLVASRSENSDSESDHKKKQKKEKERTPQFIEMKKINRSKLPSVEIESDGEDDAVNARNIKKSKVKARVAKQIISEVKSKEKKKQQKVVPVREEPKQVQISMSEQESEEDFKKVIVKSKKK